MQLGWPPWGPGPGARGPSPGPEVRAWGPAPCSVRGVSCLRKLSDPSRTLCQARIARHFAAAHNSATGRVFHWHSSQVPGQRRFPHPPTALAMCSTVTLHPCSFRHHSSKIATPTDRHTPLSQNNTTDSSVVFACRWSCSWKCQSQRWTASDRDRSKRFKQFGPGQVRLPNCFFYHPARRTASSTRRTSRIPCPAF